MCVTVVESTQRHEGWSFGETPASAWVGAAAAKPARVSFLTSGNRAKCRPVREETPIRAAFFRARSQQREGGASRRPEASRSAVAPKATTKAREKGSEKIEARQAK